MVFGKTPATKTNGTAASFSAINWTAVPLFIGTKIANPSPYKNLGSAKLWSVPYAMVSDSSKALLKGSKLAVVSTDDLSTDALFEVKRKDGQTVFAVYPNAVNVYVPRTVKGTKGGFAIGGFDGSKLGPQDYFRVTPDSVRIYIDNNPTIAKGSTKGGFAIGGFDEAKGVPKDLFTVSRDSTRVYVKQPVKGSTKGGFAIGGFDEAKAFKGNFLNLTPDNYFIGNGSGGKNTTGLYNSFIGFESGLNNTTGGNKAGAESTTGYSNVFIGDLAGMANVGGNYNVFVGRVAGNSNISGIYNTFVGRGAGQFNETGNYNTYLGMDAGMYSTGSDNVFIGNDAGKNELTGAKLYIDNSSTTSPLIYGDLSTNDLIINGNSTHNINSRTFFVNGSAGGTGAWYNDSDRRLKHDIYTIQDALDKVLRLRGVNFLWNDTTEGRTGKQLGFIGQEAFEVVPEVVSNSNDHYSMQYAPITALLVEAMKEQQKRITSVEQENVNLKSQNEKLIQDIQDLQSLKSRVEQLESVMARAGSK